MSRNRMILLAITVLYVSNLVQTSVQWFSYKGLIGMTRGSKLQTALQAEDGTNWSNIITNVIFLVSGGASDGLLVRNSLLN